MALPMLATGSINGIIDAITKIIPSIVKNLPKIITSIVSGLVKALPQVLGAAKDLFGGILTAIKERNNNAIKEKSTNLNSLFIKK